MRFSVMIRGFFTVAAACLVTVAVYAQPPNKPGPHRYQEMKRRPMMGFWSRLTPEERAKIDQLARSGQKEELRKEIKALFLKYRPEELKKLDELSAKYLQTTDEKERAAIRQEMEQQAKSLFRRRQEITRNNIAETERKLEFARQDVIEQFYIIQHMNHQVFHQKPCKSPLFLLFLVLRLIIRQVNLRLFQ